MTEYIKPAKLWFQPAVGHDTAEIAGYRLYVTPQDTPIQRQADGTVTGSQVFELGKPTPEGDGNIRVDLSALPELVNVDGTFNFGIATVDDAGNESSFFIIPEVALDFDAPDAPMDAGIERA